jgi:hypothetical protein
MTQSTNKKEYQLGIYILIRKHVRATPTVNLLQAWKEHGKISLEYTYMPPC